MLKAEATVIASDRDTLTVHSTTRSGCGHCAQQNQCGVGVISKALPGQGHQLQVSLAGSPPKPGDKVTHSIGDKVTLGIEAPDFLHSALWLYLPPLLGLLAGALSGGPLLGLLTDSSWPVDAVAVPGGLLGGLLGWSLGRMRLRRLPPVTVTLLAENSSNGTLHTPCDDPGAEVR